MLIAMERDRDTSVCPPCTASARSLNILAAASVLTLFLVSTAAFGQECLDCHDVELADGSAHEKVECVACHSDRVEFPHPEDATYPECSTCHVEIASQNAIGMHGQARAAGNEAAPDCHFCHETAHDVERPGTTPFRRATVELCGGCHSTEAEEFNQSVHGTALEKGVRNAPNCVTCHGEHDNELPSNGHRGSIRETCSGCHGDVALMSRFGLPTDRIVSYDASYHGLARRTGSQSVANCASCHGIHLILPSTDPRATTNPENLPKTCGKCHPGAGSRFALGPIHVLEGEGQAPIADLIRSVYLILIPVTLVLMFLHNLGDWIRKAIYRFRARRHIPSRPIELRMDPLERIQHAMLAVSFILLTWSGFALKFPDKWWAWPLVTPGEAFRGDLHRVCAVFMIITSVLHVISLIVNRRLRGRWIELLPRASDVREAWENFLYNIGLRSQKPGISEHSYIEKAEYWAVVWGTAIMSATGIWLWANDFFLRHFPKAIMDVATVIHFYEAILAAAAIVIWHFYSVIFDPQVYPMSMAWLTGWGPGRKESPHAEDAEMDTITLTADAAERKGKSNEPEDTNR